MFKVIIESVDSNKRVELLNELRLLTLCSLAEAKKILEVLEHGLPCALAAGLEQSKADKVLATFQEHGCAGRIEPCDLQVPVVICPGLLTENQKTFWGFSSES